MTRRLTFLSILFLAPCFVFAKGPAYTDPAKTDADFVYQGEYAGKVGDGNKGVQVIALGDGKFKAVSFDGGLPGDGATTKKQEMGEGTLKDGIIMIGELRIEKGKLNWGEATLPKVNRESPTLGKKAPEGAVVLFDGSSADNFDKGKLSEDGLLMQGCTSKEKFGSHHLHLEFRLPYQPNDRGQGRGNSGLYLQGRYEVQMLDSFGLEGRQNECGGIYSVGPPSTNMCYPPLSWQTYDVDYTAAEYKDGKLVKNPRVTVRHNGVVIHDDIELPGERNTTAAPVKAGPEPGPVYLQNHGNPVRYRNIWAIKK